MELEEFWRLYTLLPGRPRAPLQGLVFPVLRDQLMAKAPGCSWGSRDELGPGQVQLLGQYLCMSLVLCPVSTRSSVPSPKTRQEIPSVRGGKEKLWF